MIPLEFHNRIIEDTLLERWGAEKLDPLESTLADFDGVSFHMFTDNANVNLINISVSFKCWQDLVKCGVEDRLKQIYGSALKAAEPGYDATVQIDLSTVPGDKEKEARKYALLKRNCLSAPYYKAVDNKGGALIEVNYRDDEAVYLKSDADRVTVIFSVAFRDADDVILAKVFLQEYQDARKTISNAPAVTYSQKEPPAELKGVQRLRVGENNGFVSFVLFQTHLTPQKIENSIDNVMTFRNYLHYHMKCAKAYLHTRMRTKVRSFLQVLNRAKSEPESKEKKTMTGRTFKRADDPETDSYEI